MNRSTFIAATAASSLIGIVPIKGMAAPVKTNTLTCAKCNTETYALIAEVQWPGLRRNHLAEGCGGGVTYTINGGKGSCMRCLLVDKTYSEWQHKAIERAQYRGDTDIRVNMRVIQPMKYIEITLEKFPMT